MLAEWASFAIRNARLHEDVARRRAELEHAVRGLEATATVARAVGFETNLDRVLELIVKRGRALVTADAVHGGQARRARRLLSVAPCGGSPGLDLRRPLRPPHACARVDRDAALGEAHYRIEI